MRLVRLASGENVPALGLGTWRMGEARRTRAVEVAAVQTAIEIGNRLIDTADMQQLWSLPAGANCVANQVYYSASERGAEFDLLPWHRDHGVATMAYSPIDQGALARDTTFATVGRRHGVSASSVALAWVLRQPDVIAIPMSASGPHLRENFAAANLELNADDLAQIDAQFPPPKRKRRLATT